jgi:hypothetical protein
MSSPHLLTATFDTPAQVKAAVVALRQSGISQIEVYSPYPIHGIDPLLGYKRSRLGLCTLIGGITGFSTGMLLSWWTGAVDYPLIVAGMPYFSWVYTFPIAYELTILLGAFGTLFGMFIANRLPQPYHPIFDHPRWRKFTDDKLLIAVASTDPRFSDAQLRELLTAHAGYDLCQLEA